MASQIILSQPLLNDDVGAGLGIVQTRAHRPIPPINRGLNGGVGKRLVGSVGVIHYNDRAAFTSDSSSNRRNQPLAALIVGKAALRILVRVQLEPVTPQALIPRRLKQPATLHRISKRQLVGIGGMQKLHARP